ncbi:Na/Pi cotransporter family protein [Mesorhizobium xinjiangense]|uniref:Na/Pi cotransporter family protein n=1 Tax=Mesorhizobium xinjiangense TaxID=2678685 RepID=UPI0018DDB497|nr:Na/Pi symporter [Mesorhizobium xinjiangense]
MQDGSSSNRVLRQYTMAIVALLAVLALGYSFWASQHWMTLCAGLALFLFGMQCLEEGLRDLAGDTLEQMLARGTSTRLRSLLIGLVGTTALQSSTLVSLMTIAFITTGLIGLTAGIAIVFGANLGSTTGIWLLALAGQNFSLSPFALPLMIFGVLASFFGPKAKAAGRILLGIAFIFLGIDQIKAGFSTVTENFDMAQYQLAGWLGRLVFVGIGLALTLVLQSTHATLMLTLAALALGQVDLLQAAAIAIGANVGSSVTTAVAGALGGNRSGQRLALAHVLFNVVTATLALLMMDGLVWLTETLAELIGFSDNDLIMLAIFHSLFNGLGVLIFWPLIDRFARLLETVLPDRPEPRVLIDEPAAAKPQEELTRARYLDPQALNSLDTAAAAVVRELEHLGRLSIEVICHALYLPVSELNRISPDDAVMRARPAETYASADLLYRRHIKGVYADLLSFMGRIDTTKDEAHREFWTACQMVALQLVEIVKDAKHLQKNLGFYLRQPDSPTRDAYVALRRHLATVLHDVRLLGRADAQSEGWEKRLQSLADTVASFQEQFRSDLFAALRAGRIDGMQLSSLLNDLGYANRIAKGLRTLLLMRRRASGDPLRDLQFTTEDETPLVVLG